MKKGQVERQPSGARRPPPWCPECGSRPRKYVEMWTAHTIDFLAGPDWLPEEDGILGEGHPTGVIATCAGAGHTWRLRGITQISELRNARPDTKRPQQRPQQPPKEK